MIIRKIIDTANPYTLINKQSLWDDWDISFQKILTVGFVH